MPARFDINTVDWDQSGAAQNAEAKADGLTLNRIEDLHFDPRKPNVLYFVTTEGGDKTAKPADPTTSRDGGGLWKVTFDDITDPSEGGTIELLLDGSEAPYLNKPDNIAVDGDGNLLIQEDPGNNQHIARIVAYNTKTGQRGVVAQFDATLFVARARSRRTRSRPASSPPAASSDATRSSSMRRSTRPAPMPSSWRWASC